MSKPKVIEQDFTDALGNFHGHLLYWPDVMRLTPLHHKTLTTRFWQKVGNWVLSRRYQADRRQAAREIRRYGARAVEPHPYKEPG